MPVCVIAGVILDQEKLRSFTNDFLVLKGRWYPHVITRGHFLERVKHEIKGSDLRRAMRQGGSRNRRRHTIGFLDDFVTMLETYDTRLIGRVWVKGVGEPCNGSALYTSSMQAIASYFQHFLEGAGDAGTIIADSRTPALNAEVAHSVFTQKFKAPGDEYGRVLEMPTFGHSENHVGIQVADLAASALLFPMASFAYCVGHVPATNVHVDTGFEQVTQRYGDRLRDLQYRYRDAGRFRGGITVNDRISKLSGGRLFGR